MVLAPPADDKDVTARTGGGVYRLISAILWRRRWPCSKLRSMTDTAPKPIREIRINPIVPSESVIEAQRM